MEQEPKGLSLRDIRFPDIDEYFLSIALLAAKRSKDPCTQVGACVVNRQNVYLGSGYNGMPRGCNDDETPWSKTSNDPLENKFYFVCHAELNAIANAKRNLEDCKIYVTLFPCNECAKMIIQHGITEVVYLSDENKHKSSTIAAKMMLDRASVKHRQCQSNRKFVIELPNINKQRESVEQLIQAVEKLDV